ncbi:unnamed protein product [Calicophoron daubneyi]|uniref:Leucine-rich repeat and coiled-coil domain-containing protein 1 n=1 Tax=Calicophoron daubneyi TaxID=300641 RepID=A0AAV2T2R7_CALDB
MARNTELNFIDAKITSIADLNLSESLTALNLHHNLIQTIDGLQALHCLQHLNLSSNSIRDMKGLDTLRSLRTLNLSSNKLVEVRGLGCLYGLVQLDLSFNLLEDVDGLKDMYGPSYNLTVVHLQGNRLKSVDNLLDCARGLINLRQLTLFDPQAGANNPMCKTEDYRRTVLAGLPRLEILDHMDSNNRPVRLDVLADIPELAGLIDYVSSASLSCTKEENEVERHNQDSFIQKFCAQSPDQFDFEQRNFHNMNQPAGGSLENENHRVTKDESAEYSGTHPECSLNSITERRLINLENQLSSLVALQLMRLNQAVPGDRPTVPGDTEQSGCVQPPADSTNQTAGAGETMTDRRPKRGRIAARNEPRKITSDSTLTHSTSGRKADESPKLSPHVATKLQNSVNPPRPQSCIEVGTQPSNIVTTLPDEHPPGAPKKHQSGSSGRSTPKPQQSPHPIHGKPIISKRTCPSVSTQSADPMRFNQTGNDYGRKSSSTRKVDVSEMRPTKLVDDVAGRTLGQVLKDLDAERLQRKQTEELCRDMTERILRLEASAVDETKALEATNKLKLAFNSERRARLNAEAQLRELDARMSDVFAAVDGMRAREEAERARVNSENNQMSMRLTELSKDYQDSVARAERAEKRLDEVQCMLKSRELEYKEMMESRFALSSPEVTKLIADRVEAVELRHEQTVKSLQEKLNDSTSRFVALEDEFRMALRIEAERYAELYKSAEILKGKLSDAEAVVKDLEIREESARNLVSELTSAIKDQKARATTQQKSNLLLQHNQKEKIVKLEAQLEEACSRLTKMENLKKQEYKQLQAELAAKESLVAGLRAERRNWSEELAQQGTALAQDRGRLESKIEAQTLEIASLKKNLEEECDAVKIKTKIIDDQMDTIRNLKKGLTENQAELKRVQNEALENQKQLEEQISRLKKENEENLDKIQKLITRKEELKDTVADLRTRVDELEAQNKMLDQRWSERTNLLDKLEKQVEQMRGGWENEHKALVEERDAARGEVNALQAQMERMDAGFRDQLAAAISTKEKAVIKAREEAEQLRSNCESRVANVEAEMRAVLMESENARYLMESRLRKLSAVLCDPLPPDPLLPPRNMSASALAYVPPLNTEWLPSSSLVDAAQTSRTTVSSPMFCKQNRRQSQTEQS